MMTLRPLFSKNPACSRRLFGTSLLLGVTIMLNANANANAEERRTTVAVDANAPIHALSTLSSLAEERPLTMTVPHIEQFTTASGVRVMFVRTTALPIVDIDLRFNAGSARDTSIRTEGYGIAHMAAMMLTQGTQQLDEDAFSRATETLGITLSSRAYKDMFIVSLRSLSDEAHLPAALNLVHQAITQPTFETDVLERNKARLLVGLQQQQQDPSSLANQAFDKALYGDHPYAHPSTGTLKSVPTISQSDLEAFKSQYLVAQNASLAITGNLTLEAAKTLADRLTADLPQGDAAPVLPTPIPPSQSQRIHIPFASSQTTVLMGQLGERRATDPRGQLEQTYFTVGNDVLAGGSFNARLMTQIRQNLGYTYGIAGGMSPMLVEGPYRISFSTRNDKARAAIDAAQAVIDETLKTGISDQEMVLTTDNLKNSFPMSFASNAGINGLLGMMNFYELPVSYLSDYAQRLSQVTLPAVNASLRETLDPERFLIVTVGDSDPWTDD